MLPISRRHAHFVFAVIQSGITSGIASFVAAFSLGTLSDIWPTWLTSWAMSWALMIPVVLLAAPGIRRLSTVLTRDDASVGTDGFRQS